MTDFITQALIERRTGLSLHYPLLHAAVLGLAARRTLEFGAGGSTRVFIEALPKKGIHTSISTETAEQVTESSGAFPGPYWIHLHGCSDAYRDFDPGPLDLVLHDGSHAADVVSADIAWAWPHLRQFGLLLVHDTQHSYCGAEMRTGLQRGLRGARFSATTLPYGFGLTIIRREEGGPLAVAPGVAKADSAHTTEPCVLWRPDGGEVP